MTPCGDLFRELRPGRERFPIGELDSEHRAPASNIGHDARIGEQRLKDCASGGFDLAGIIDERAICKRLEDAEGSGTGEGVSRVGAAKATSVHGVHQLDATGDRAQRQAASESLGGNGDVAHDLFVVAREEGTGAAHARLDLVQHEDDAMSRCDLTKPRQEPG